jgi:hypothetical protein
VGFYLEKFEELAGKIAGFFNIYSLGLQVGISDRDSRVIY